MVKKVIIFTDGASRGNPGQAAAGFVIQTDDGVIWSENGVYLDVVTNNVAEYSAVKLALKKLATDFINWLPAKVLVKADSLLIVEQLSGRYKIRNSKLKVFFDEIKSLEEKVGEVRYLHIPREKNFLADRLANQALDKKNV